MTGTGDKDSDFVAMTIGVQEKAAAEQARWSDFNGRLDELERSLTTKR